MQSIDNAYSLRNKFECDVNPDCIKVCPFDDDVFCLGHYHQVEEQNIQGAISILLATVPPQLVSSTTAPILHLVWLNRVINDRMYVMAACRNSTIKIFEFNRVTAGLIEVKTIAVGDNGAYCLYIDAVVAEQGINVIVSTNKSEVVFFSLNFEFEIQQEFRGSDHEYAVWCCRINPFQPKTFLSGDEISNLIQGDIRANPIKIAKDSKVHQNGISDICFSGRENEFLTGSFDGIVRWFDIRQIHKPVKEYKTEGVVWRIIPEATGTKLLLCVSSANKFLVLQGQSLKQRWIQEHKSLTYAADWSGKSIVTGSFYDKLVCVWDQ